MGLMISFENDKIFKSMKTGYFLDILERLELRMPRTLESQALKDPEVNKSGYNFHALGACEKRLVVEKWDQFQAAKMAHFDHSQGS